MHRTLLLIPVLLASCASAPERRPAPTVVASAEPTLVRSQEDRLPEGPMRLTVPDAIEVAMERNPDLGIAAARILAAYQGVEEARSGWYPQLRVYGDYTYTNDPVLVFMQTLRQRDLQFGGDFNHPGRHQNFRAGAQLDWLLLDFGRRSAAVDLAKISAGIEEGSRDAVQNELRAAVIGVALAVYEAEEFIRVAEESVKLVNEQLKIARSRFDAGAAQRSDVLSVEVRRAEAGERLVRAENGRRRALASLKNLLGLEAGEEFELVAGEGFDVPDLEEGDLLLLARENRPELRRAADAVRAAEREVEMYEAEYFPTVSAYGSYALDDEKAAFTLDQDSFATGVRVDLPVFQGFRTKARISGAKARIRQARQAERKARLQVEQDVTQALLGLEESRARLEVSVKAEEQAEEALSLIRARYESGAATITEYLDAEVALTGARVRNVAARYDVERATADLRRAVGICRAAPGGQTGGER